MTAAPTCARSSSTTPPSATGPRARTSRSRSPTSSAIARMLDEYGMPFIEGGWPGSNPKDVEFFAAAKTITLGAGEARRVRLHPPPANRPEDDPNLQELVAAETPVVTIFGKSWLLHVTKVLGATPRAEPRHDRGLGGIRRRPRAARPSTTPSTTSTATGPIRDYALATLRAARQAGARTPRPLRHERRHAHGRPRPDRRPRRGPRSRATRTRPAVVWGIHTHNDADLAVANSLAAVAGRHPPRPGHDQRLRRALRQREHGEHPGEPRAQDPASRSCPPAGATSRT